MKKHLSSRLNLLYKLNEGFDSRLIDAAIKNEDKRFNIHYGHDLLSIRRALINNTHRKRIQGASTIEQQLVRTLLEINGLTTKRKITEILFSSYLNKKYTKSEIINFYLNSYHFSNDKIGVKELCKKENYNYFNLSHKDICAIVARIKYPTITTQNHIRYLKRVRTIEKITNT